MLKPLLYIFPALLTVCAASAPAQTLRAYYVECSQDDYDYMINHPEEDVTIPCTFLYDGRVWRNVTFSLRGESSRFYPKKSFRLNFPADNRLENRDKVNLVAGWTDPSFAREYLSYESYRRAGLPASRAWHTRLYVNRRYAGLYLDVEEIDRHYLAAAEIPENSTIYKAAENGALLRADDDIEALWDIRANAGEGFAALRRLTEWIDNVRDDEFFTTLDDWFSRNELARVIALNAILGNASTYYHNYFLIREPGEMGRWHFLPWDLDQTFYFYDEYSSPKYHRSGHQSVLGDNRLIVRCWRDPRMRERIFTHMDGLIDSLMRQDSMLVRTDRLRFLLSEAVEQDTVRQFSPQQFRESLDRIPGDIARRGGRLLLEKGRFPMPFGIEAPQITPDGLFLTWDTSAVPGGQAPQYEVWISGEVSFPDGNRRVIGGVRVNRLRVEDPPATGFFRVYAIKGQGERTMAIPYFTGFRVPAGAIGGRTPPNVVNRDTTWRRQDGVVRLPDGLTVRRGATLTIEPGIRIGVGEQARIRVEGTLNVGALNGDTTRIGALDPAAGWGGVVVREGTLNLNRVFISGVIGDTAAENRVAAIDAERSTLSIIRSRITNGIGDGIKASASSLSMRACRIDHFGGNLLKAHVCAVNLSEVRFDHADLLGRRSDLIDIDQSHAGMRLFALQLFGPADDGIDLDACDDVLIDAVRIAGVRDNAISIGGASRDVLMRNILATGNGTGASIHDSSQVRIYNSVFAFNDEGVASRRNRAADVVVRNSVLWRNGAEIVNDGDGVLNVGWSVVRGDTLYPGQQIQNRDVHFVDQWGWDFHPREESPLIDAGLADEYTPDFDIAGAPRRDAPGIANRGAGRNAYTDIGVYEFGSVVSVEEEVTPPPPHSPLLLSAYPNPFNQSVRLRFWQSAAGAAKLVVYSVDGRTVHTEHLRLPAAGWVEREWDGRSGQSACPAGVYLVRLSAAGSEAQAKIVLIR